MSNGVLRGRNVLIVEDQYLIARELGRLVERLGGRVVAAVSGIDAALAALKSKGPDLVLLDVNLDGERSYPVAEALRAAGMPFVFTTGYDHSAIDRRFADVPYVEKPVSEPNLIAAIGEARVPGLA